MKTRLAIFFSALMLLLGTLQGARAEAVISFSVAGNAYGWCAGYAKRYAESCAQKTCASGGETDCQIILECNGGWGSVAMNADSKIVGVGATCHRGNAYSARIEALANCIVASRALCWTYSTFSPRGGIQPKDQNLTFDLDWYAQGALALLGDYHGSIDGNFGAASTQALEKFQTDIGRTPDGVVNQEIVARLLDGVGGFTAFTPTVKKTFLAGETQTGAENSYGHAMAPSTAATFGDELIAEPPDEQRLAVATFMSVHNTKCSLPAQSAVVLPNSQNTAWNVTCAEGPYSLFISSDDSIVTMPGLSSPGAVNGIKGPPGAAPGVTAAAVAPEPQPASGQPSPDGMQALPTGAPSVAAASPAPAPQPAASPPPADGMQPLPMGAPTATASPAPETQRAPSQPSGDSMQPLSLGAPIAQQSPAPAPPAQIAPLGAPITVNAFVSGAGLQSSCPATSPGHTACVAYVQGVIDAFVAAAGMRAKPQQLCLPFGETGPEIAQLVDDYMAHHPELQQSGGPTVILQAIQEKAPCNTQ